VFEGVEFGLLYCGLFRCSDTENSFTRHDLPALLGTHFVGDHMEGQTLMYSVVAP
jgi:hypothetical protein